jgi:hypothetical protein
MTQAKIAFGAEDDDVAVVPLLRWSVRARLDVRSTRHWLFPSLSGTTSLSLCARGPANCVAMHFVERRRPACPSAITSTLVDRVLQAAPRLRRLLHGNFGPCKNTGETVSRLLPICSQTSLFECGRLSAAIKRKRQDFAHTNPFFHAAPCCKGAHMNG